jgi:acetylornithine deacetylase/succinyl-diaminopimelate desuccinylase-like protein
MEKLKSWYAKHSSQVQNDFFTFLRFPSISTDTQYDPQTRACANWLCDYFRKIGMDVELWETERLPVVFASHLKAGPGRPTLLLYHHYDVQPVDPLELWKTPPFEPAVRNNQVYARGALDNKGQCFYSLTALKAFLELADRINVNIKVFIEGEEESGGKGSTGILPKKRKELKADHLVVVDMDIPGPGVPGIQLGMRGLTALEISCRNSATDLHSGTHGGIALNPNRALVKALAQLWDDQGKVAVPHFYDDVVITPPAELKRLDLDFDLESYKKNFGVKAFAPEGDYSLLESNWTRPTLELNGVGGGYTGKGFKTVIPAEAIAKVSCRLVPNQDPEKISHAIAKFLKAHVPAGIELDVNCHHGARAFRSSPEAPIAKICASAYEEVFGKRCKLQLCGASIPIVPDLVAASGAQAALIGMGLQEDNIHAPNEHFGLDRFEQGFLVISKILQTLNDE